MAYEMPLGEFGQGEPALDAGASAPDMDLDLSGGWLDSGGFDFGGDGEGDLDLDSMMIEPLGDAIDPDLDEIDGGELDLSITSDGFDFDSESIFGGSDICRILNEYYQNINDILERMRPTQVKSDDKFMLSAADFPYLDSRAISALSKAILAKAEEQQKLPENRRLDPDDAAEEIFDKMTELIPLSLGAHYDNFIDMCGRQYENFFKRASAASTKVKPKFESIVDKKKLEEAKLTCYINGYLWNQVSVCLSDPSVNRDLYVNQSSGRGTIYNVAIIGTAMEFYNEALQNEGRPPVTIKNMTTGDLFDCVSYILNRQNMMSTLHLSQDAVTNMSPGELLRRYVLLENEEGLLDWSEFKLSDAGCPLMHNVANVSLPTFGRINIQYPSIKWIKEASDADYSAFVGNLMPIYTMLSAPFIKGKDGKPRGYTESVTHELLYYIYYLLAYATNKGKGPGGFIDFFMGLNVFFASLYIDSPYTNPVMYYTPSPTEDKQAFDLNFTVNDQYYSVRSESLLATVVGDSSKTYIYPSVYPISSASREVKKVGDDNADFTPPTCVLLPLNSIYEELRGDASSVGASNNKNRLDSSTEYVYTPSLLWVVSRSYSSQSDIDSSNVTEAISNRTTNPLLDMLLNYTNKFEPETTQVNPGIVRLDDGTEVLYLREGSNPDATFACALDTNGTVMATSGTLGFDEEDGSLIMQYFRDPGDAGTLVAKNQGEYEVTEHDILDSNKVDWPAADNFLHIPPYQDLGIHAKSYMRAVNQRLCKLNALDYAEELDAVRHIISRDLAFVVPTFKMDSLLATKAIEPYEAYVQQEGYLEDTNMESLRELSKIVLGKGGSPIAGKDRWDDSCTAVFEAVRKAQDNNVKYVESIIDMYDVNVIALQGLAISNTTNLDDIDCYMALHCIPSLHRRLRDLEERMLTLRILNEIGQDIAPILRRASPLLTVYNKTTTLANIDDVENSLKSGMSGGKKFDAMPLTRKVLSSEVGGSTPILKYFALCKNIYGIMSTAISSDDEQERELYTSLHHCLGLDADGMPLVTQLDEATFSKAPFAVTIDEACELNREKLLALIERGILADTSARIDIRIVKAFDLLVTYGHLLFNIELGGEECENFEDIAEFQESFYTYVGSFFISYCLVTGDSLAEVEGSRNRIEAFRSDYTGFADCENLLPLSGLELETELRGQWGD